MKDLENNVNYIKKEIGTLTIWMEKIMYSTLILIFLLIGILIVIGLMIYQIISQEKSPF